MSRRSAAALAQATDLRRGPVTARDAATGKTVAPVPHPAVLTAGTASGGISVSWR